MSGGESQPHASCNGQGVGCAVTFVSRGSHVWVAGWAGGCVAAREHQLVALQGVRMERAAAG